MSDKLRELATIVCGQLDSVGSVALGDLERLKAALADSATADEEAKIDENLERLKEANLRTGKVDHSIRVSATVEGN